MITAALQPTALTIRHSRFATLTLAKLVASLALHPPSSATEADYAPHHRLRRSLSSRRSLLVAVLSNCCQSLCKISAPNHAPPWHADRRSAQGWRSQTEGESRKRTEESLLSSGRFRLSPATVSKPQFCLPVLFQQLLRHTQVLWYFLDSRKYRPPVPPFSPAYALCCFSMPSLSAISAMNSPLVGLSSGMATRQPNARFSDSTRPRLQATSMAWRMARSTLLGLVA